MPHAGTISDMSAARGAIVAAALIVFGVIVLVARPGWLSGTATPDHASPKVPTNMPPDNVGGGLVTIAKARFSVSQAMFPQAGISVIHVMNTDATAYSFEIAPNLVSPIVLSPNAVTDIEFAANGTGDYIGLLLPQEGEGMLDSIAVHVMHP